MQTDPFTSSAHDVQPLFRPLTIAGCEITNRIVMAPMTRMFGVDGVNAPTAVEYYRRRAAGGAGLIVTEGIATSRIGAQNRAVPELRAGAPLARWQEVVDAVHQAGGRIFAQLWHAGLGRLIDQAADPTEASIGPQAWYLPQNSVLAAHGGNHAPGHAMTTADVDATIQEYVTAAANALSVGFDGVEVHAAHGYLVDEFLWSESNSREDRYGGNAANRVRFAVEIIQAIRERVTPQYPIGFRFSQWKSPHHYSIKAWDSPAGLEATLAPLTDAGVDYFHASTRRYWETEFGTNTTLAGWAKKITGKPAMLVGSIGVTGLVDPSNLLIEAPPDANLERVVEKVASGEVDLIAVGRGMLANPDWAHRVRVGDLATLSAYDKESLFNHQ